MKESGSARLSPRSPPGRLSSAWAGERSRRPRTRAKVAARRQFQRLGRKNCPSRRLRESDPPPSAHLNKLGKFNCTRVAADNNTTARPFREEIVLSPTEKPGGADDQCLAHASLSLTRPVDEPIFCSSGHIPEANACASWTRLHGETFVEADVGACLEGKGAWPAGRRSGMSTPWMPGIPTVPRA